MITRLNFDNDGNFTIFGTIKFEFMNFTTKTINQKQFFEVAIESVIELKETIIEMLSDDKKVLGEERIIVVRKIDNLLTLFLGYAIINSNVKNLYSAYLGSKFTINIELSHKINLKGNGMFINVSSNDITDFSPWINDKLIGTIKKLISYNNNKRKNEKKIDKELIELIFHILSLRYKVEYI